MAPRRQLCIIACEFMVYDAFFYKWYKQIINGNTQWYCCIINGVLQAFDITNGIINGALAVKQTDN